VYVSDLLLWRESVKGGEASIRLAARTATRSPLPSDAEKGHVEDEAQISEQTISGSPPTPQAPAHGALVFVLVVLTKGRMTPRRGERQRRHGLAKRARAGRESA